MEDSLTPLTRALRRFGAGKPVTRSKDTPLNAVLLASEQRERLRGILDSEEGLESPRITHAAIAIRLKAPGVPIEFDDAPIEVVEGTESEAVQYLEGQIKCGNGFTVSGLTFVVEAGADVRVFQYRLDRTPEGASALRLAGEKVLRRKVKG